MASIVDTSVKHAYSSMVGAPVINGTAGSLIATLRAFLVTGWGAKSVDSAAISNGVCRLTFASGKSAAEVNAVIQVAGAAPAGLNGEQRVTAVANGWIEFKTDLPDGAVTGSLSFKMAGLGWEEVYSKTNVSVFRPTDPRGTRMYYRVDDSGTTQARVQMHESMTDVDTGSGVAPAQAGGFYWTKKGDTGTEGVYWLLIGDAQGFYFTCSPYGAASLAFGATTRYAGDINSYRSGDAWCAMLSGSLNGSGSSVDGCMFSGSTTGTFVVARQYHGLGSAVSLFRKAFGESTTSGNSNALGSFPSKADNGLRLAPVLLVDADNSPRGEAPGLFHCPQNGLAAVFPATVTFTDGAGKFAGQKLLSVGVGPLSNNAVGIGFFDATVPWRKP